MGSTIVAGVQVDIEIGKKKENLQKIVSFCKRASQEEARIAIFPELTLTGYAFDEAAEVYALAEPVPGPSTVAVSKACRTLGMMALFGLVEKAGEEFYNAAVLVGGEGVLGLYRKIHLPYLGADRFLSPGNLPLSVFKTRYGNLGCLICYDGSFPECARVLALRGADMIALCTNWPNDPDSEGSQEILTPARGIENHVYYLAVNRVGVERGIIYLGKSRFVDFKGRTIVQASPDREEVILAEIHLELARDRKIVFEPGRYEMDRFAQRRPEYYKPICEPITEQDAPEK